jgi:spore maturation protein CgeB
VTRQAMVASGFSPSVRLFEAAACGCPIISDDWCGLDTFLVPDEEILVAESCDQVVSILTDCDAEQIRRIAARARERVLAEHSSARRAEEFENYVAAARLRPNTATLAGVVPANAQRSLIPEETLQLTN